jgi:hypothetical protein
MVKAHSAAGKSTRARNRSPAWALIFAMSVCAACGQPVANKSQAVIAPTAPTTSAAPGNSAASASTSPANNASPPNAVAGNFPPAPAAPPFSERFGQYPVSVFQGPVVYPDFAGAQKPYANFRTRLTDAVKGGVNFAGRYALVQFGCGMGCTQGYMIDLTNGQVAPLPLGNLTNAGIEYASRPDSTLLQTVWRSDLLVDANGNPLNHDPTPTCVYENLVLQDGKFTVLDQNKTPTLCP